MINIAGFAMGELLYQGPNSHVYRARRESDDLPVVLKIPSSMKLSIRENLRFQHEYDLLASLRLPRVVKVYDLAQYRGSFAIVEEDYGACDVARFLGDNRLDLHRFFPMSIQMAEALAQLHEQGILHKDVHLANILVHPKTGEVKLTDFGMSSLIDGEVQEPCNPDQIEGSLYYISPEQTGRMNRSIDSRSDLYSLGVCFYRILTGVLPFTALDPMEVLHAHLARRPVAPRELDASIPQALSALVMRLLEKKAEDRYQSANGLLHDLESMRAAWLSGASLAGQPLGTRDMSFQFQVAQKIYGREREAQLLSEAFQRVAKGGSELMLVGGYSGIGKTSLVNEVHKGLTRYHGRFISGKHDQFQRDIPFSAFLQAFRHLANQILAESESRVATWRQALLDALGGNARVIVDVIPEIEHLIGPQAPAPELGPAEAQNRFIMCLQRFIQVFARREHPLVIFLDDLQWSDSPSLNLLQALARGSETPYLLLLGAYRDNEVSPTHPLMTTVNRLIEDGSPARTVLLSPLGLPDLRQLTADTLHRPVADVEELTLLIQEKTGGNPFFVSQMLKELHARGVFQLDRQRACWLWDMPGIRAMGLTDNVVDLMAGKIIRMPPRTQAALQLAACVGNRFTLAMLATIYEKTESATSEDLWEAIQSGLLIPFGEGFRFLHDRVQQAAYSLIPPADIAPARLRIGRLLLRHAGQANLDDAIFDIVAHLNAAASLIDAPEERLSLAALNVQAGRKAKTSTAYEPALRHFRMAARLLPEDSWRSQYRLTLEVFREQADAAYLLGDFPLAETLLDEALRNARDRFDMVEVYLQKITQYNQLGKYNELMDIARDALHLFGVILPAADDAAALATRFAAQMAEYAALLGQRPIAAIIDAPNVADRDQDSIIRLMAILTDGAYIAVPTLFPHVVMEVVTRSMRHGHNAMSAIGFAWATVVIVQQHQDYRGAFDLGTLSMRLIERFPNPRIQAQITFLYAVCAMHWFLPLSEQIDMYKRAYQYGMENGNLVFAGYARTMIPKTVLAASTVDKALEENGISVAFYEKSGSPFYMSERFCNLFLRNLKEASSDPFSLSGPDMDEQTCLEQWLRPETLFGHGLAYFLNFKIQLLYLFGDPLGAWRFATAHADWMRYIPILYETTVFCFYQAMAAATVLEDANEEDRRLMERHVRDALAEFTVWAENCPANFAWQQRLLRAEQARLEGRLDEALEFYDHAASIARDHAHPQGVALARERAGRLHRQRGNPEAARISFEDAGFNYYKWGAHAKMLQLRKELEERPGEGLDAPRSSQGPSASSGSGHFHPSSPHLLDFGSLLKAMRAISKEIQLDVLLRTIMTSVIENAGAERGFLLLPGETDWTVAAMALVDNKNASLHSSPLTGSTRVSEAIVRFVIRGRQEVILEDAGQHPTFRQDPHVVEQGVRSVLCLPLLSQSRLSGVLYLENNLAPGVFAIERTQIAKMLAAQAAISIENAKLYGSLAASEQRYRGVFEEASDLIFLTATDGRVEDVNPACLGMTGYPREEMLTRNIVDLYAIPEERRRFQRGIEEEGNVRGYELLLRRKDGELIDVVLTAGVRRDEQGQIVGYQGIMRDATAQKQAERLRAAYSQDLERQVAERTRELSEANDKLQRLSECDGLTGIPNRRKFDAVLDAEWKRAMRQGSPLSVALIDVDQFKAYNDHFGHQSGDDCLRRIARTLASKARRTSDLAARYGGEEFVIILPGLSSSKAKPVAEKLRQGIEALRIPHAPIADSDVVTVSVGVASCVPEQGSQPAALLMAADANLYQAKGQGRNRVVLS